MFNHCRESDQTVVRKNLLKVAERFKRESVKEASRQDISIFSLRSAIFRQLKWTTNWSLSQKG
jgi:hypothetical protein